MKAPLTALLISIVVPFISDAADTAAAARPNLLFCIADDWSWPHAGAYGDKVVRTPTFDRIAREGALFNFAFCASPSCTPSRAAILTGRAVHQLDEGANLWGFLPSRFETYPEILERAGYFIGSTRKGWGPGNFQAGGRTRNPAGPQFKKFAAFLNAKPKDKPFCFWFGSHDPHRPYDPGTGVQSGMDADNVKLPGFWPDSPQVRRDVLDYYFEVQRCDQDAGELVALLEQRGELDNTLVIFTSDNGMPFPRCKANLYDGGTRMPFAIRFPKRIKAGTRVDAFVNLQDIAPTMLEFAGLPLAPEMVGRSVAGLVTGKNAGDDRDAVFLERERHANVRKGDASYPVRAIRTKDFLYIRNLRPERWPAGDPEMWKAVGEFGDCDAGPTKSYILQHKGDMRRAFELSFGKRPADELYDLRRDPDQTNNIAGDAAVTKMQRELRARLDDWMKRTGDPRVNPNDERFDTFPYFGDARRMPPRTR